VLVLFVIKEEKERDSAYNRFNLITYVSVYLEIRLHFEILFNSKSSLDYSKSSSSLDSFLQSYF
jgi:hypothetical protein